MYPININVQNVHSVSQGKLPKQLKYICRQKCTFTTKIQGTERLGRTKEYLILYITYIIYVLYIYIYIYIYYICCFYIHINVIYIACYIYAICIYIIYMLYVYKCEYI